MFCSTPLPIWKIPFPALTLCNMNKVIQMFQLSYNYVKVRKSKVSEIVQGLKEDPTNLYLLKEEFFVDEVSKVGEW